MWIVIGTLVVLTWLFFFFRARRLASTLDRAEVIVLRPLVLTYLLLAIAMALSAAWIVAGICVVAFFFNGVIGASLHRSRTFSELAEGTFHRMEKGPRAELSHVESHQVSSTILRATFFVAAVVAALMLHYSFRWYFAIPIALVSWWLFMVASIFLVAFRRKGSSTTAAG
jgi:hypothetical protein